jgi:hypothetical protein
LAKVARAINLGTPARLAKSVFVHGTHEVVVDAATDWVAVWLVDITSIDLLNRHVVDLLTAEDREGQSVDFVERYVGIF